MAGTVAGAYGDAPYPSLRFRVTLIRQRDAPSPADRADNIMIQRWNGTLRVIAALCALTFPPIPTAAAAQDAMAAQTVAPRVGPVTNLPLPRYVSLKTNEGNVRRGPSLSHRIDWVYMRKDLPLEITAEYGHWRRVRDRDGLGGWVHYALLSGNRTVVIEAEEAALRQTPDGEARVTARAQRGVVARLGPCVTDWCEIRSGPYRGWARKTALWGVGADELRD